MESDLFCMTRNLALYRIVLPYHCYFKKKKRKENERGGYEEAGLIWLNVKLIHYQLSFCIIVYDEMYSVRSTIAANKGIR